jgi:S-adenosylmethionine:tRNA ribosyltransferase-isomerase
MGNIVRQKELRISDFSYVLPEHRIATYPLSERSESKLLVYQQGEIRKSVFKSIGEFLPDTSLLIFNDTKVIHARIKLMTANHHPIECFCLEPVSKLSVEEVFRSNGPMQWMCMVGNARNWKSGPLYKSIDGKYGVVDITFNKVGQEERDFIIDISWNNSFYSFSEILEQAGELPIPPYLKRATEAQDELRYNTIYATQEGSVAAPTAGLHFTDSILEKLKCSGKELAYVTLHVGAGTFLPVKSATMEGHEMHAERIEVSLQTIAQLARELGRRPVLTVGTTSTRTIESLYWMGCRWMKEGRGEDSFLVNQWEPYEYNVDELPSTVMVFSFLEKWMKENQLESLSGYTRLIIAPGYNFQVVDGLITNFHQPGSTLLLLVAALVGDDWRKIYDFALTNNFRFLSYGDSSLLYR